jgi:hypothetical protein
MFDLIDQCLDWIDLKDFPDRFIMGVLTITASCARQLTRREDFFKDVEARFTMKHGSKKASKMLKGLAREEGWRPIKEVRHADRETGDATRVTHQADT